MPIRFWEDKTPTKCIVETNKIADWVNVKESSTDSIFVYSEKHKHNGYIERKSLFFSEENCKKAIELYSALNDLYHIDECDKITERIIKEKIC